MGLDRSQNTLNRPTLKGWKLGAPTSALPRSTRSGWAGCRSLRSRPPHSIMNAGPDHVAASRLPQHEEPIESPFESSSSVVDARLDDVEVAEIGATSVPPELHAQQVIDVRAAYSASTVVPCSTISSGTSANIGRCLVVVLVVGPVAVSLKATVIVATGQSSCAVTDQPQQPKSDWQSSERTTLSETSSTSASSRMLPWRAAVAVFCAATADHTTTVRTQTAARTAPEAATTPNPILGIRVGLGSRGLADAGSARVREAGSGSRCSEGGCTSSGEPARPNAANSVSLAIETRLNSALAAARSDCCAPANLSGCVIRARSLNARSISVLDAG